MSLLLEAIRSGSDEYRYDKDPSSVPTLLKAYDVAKFGDEREDKLRDTPLGVGKSSRASQAISKLAHQVN